VLYSLWTRLARKFGFWLKLFAVTAFSHVFLFFLFFFVCGQKSVFSIDINRSILNSGAPIIFMNIETGASVRAKGTKNCSGKKCNSKKSNAKNKKNVKAENKRNKQKAKKNIKYKSKLVAKQSSKIAEKKLQDQKNKKRKLIEAKKLQAKKAREKKLLEKKLQDKKQQQEKIAQEKKLKEIKEKNKLDAKKILEKKLKETKIKEALDKKIEEKKLEEKKLKEQKIKETQKIEQEKKEAEKMQEYINLPEPEEDNNINKVNIPDGLTVNVQEKQSGSSEFNDQETVYIGQHEVEILKIQYEVEREVAKYWRPPEGLSKDLSCAVNVLIDWDGRVTQVLVVKSSGVLMYDISARVAASKLVLPSSLYGKDINIVFNQ